MAIHVQDFGLHMFISQMVKYRERVNVVKITRFIALLEPKKMLACDLTTIIDYVHCCK